ncbi:DNA cytosine methyltransferase [Cobetia amphilecti]|uniref:DNA cytosine methyltransferase n=1 Tax=Cobetia amphilecti TaxID=1055104 RepID=UPI00244CC206|nr:DNA cytosine methyltransferase [Cobetia litoralis]MDH2420630.1 DNA cytosine methyltransferase [Cobetia litoralis]
MIANPTSIESFCGAGGMALGLKAAGFNTSLSFDLDSAAIKTYQHSIGKEAILADATKISSNEILDLSGLKKGEVTLFSGGPPCQGYSKQRKGAHFLDDPRNRLITNYVRFVKELEPQAFILENVAIFGQKRGREQLKELADVLYNYNLYPEFYNTADYGLAQKRERFILVGILRDYSATFVKPLPHKCKRTVGEVIGDLPEPPEDFSVHPDYFNHQRARVTKANIERFSHVPQGGGWQDIPFELRLPCHQKADPSKGGWPDVYGRLRWDGQCPTITGGFDSFSRGRYGHPIYDRPLTPREAARLQGFPDSIHFQGTRQEVRYQIGNAVPPPLAKEIGEQVARVLNGTAPSLHTRNQEPHQMILA